MTEAEIEQHMLPGEGCASFHDGEAQAAERAGPWPVAGTLQDYALASARAEREARRAYDLIDRFTSRYRLRDRPYDPTLAQQVVRASARYHAACEISRERDERLRLLAAPRGSA